MRTSTIISSILAVAFCASPALADDQHHDRERDHDRYRGDHDRYRGDHDRDRGRFMRNPREHGRYRFDPRPQYVIRNDPHFSFYVHGYRPHHAWRRYHLTRGGWLGTWGVASWRDVGTITCEAVNQDTGQMYPVSADRDDFGWSAGGVNLMLDQALDSCYADGGGAACTPMTPACTIQR